MAQGSTKRELAERQADRPSGGPCDRRPSTAHSSDPSQGALALAYRDHGPDIYRYLLAKTRDAHLAEDLTQEVFADAALMPVSTPASAGLLFLIARRRFVDEVRENHRRPRCVPLDPYAVGAESPMHHPGLGRLISESVLALPPCQQRVFVMRLLEGRPFAEIASELSTSEAACRKRFDRARRSVCDRLEDGGCPTSSVL